MIANGSWHQDGRQASLYSSLLLPSYAVSLTVSLISLISLVFTLWIFLRRRDATAGARGMVLLIATDIFASMALAGVHIVSLSEAANVTLATTPAWKRFADIQFTVTNASLLLRNWWVAFLTLARLIVVLFPLHVTEILTRRRQVAAFVVILISSAAVSGARYAEEVACASYADTAVGAAASSATTASSATVAASSASCESFVLFFFVMQTGLPVPVVLVISVVLAVHLCTAPPTNTTEEAAAAAAAVATAPRAARSSVPPPPPSRPQLLKRRATRILLVLAATFTALEVPTLVCSMCLYTLPSFRSSELSRLLVSLSNCLVTLDTLAIFFVFFVFSKSFKVEVKRCLCSQRLWQQQQQQQQALLLQRRGTSERRRPPGTAMETMNEDSGAEQSRG